jgi:hypothetical protein
MAVRLCGRLGEVVAPPPPRRLTPGAQMCCALRGHSQGRGASQPAAPPTPGGPGRAGPRRSPARRNDPLQHRCSPGWVEETRGAGLAALRWKNMAKHAMGPCPPQQAGPHCWPQAPGAGQLPASMPPCAKSAWPGHQPGTADHHHLRPRVVFQRARGVRAPRDLGLDQPSPHVRSNIATGSPSGHRSPAERARAASCNPG